ncbi:hypothetical protein ACSZM7_06245 [Aeromonas veronii]|nr:hypothetical protein [Aeromonas veronii]
MTGLSFLALRAGLVAKQQTIRLATVKALQQKSSTRKWKTGTNDPQRPKAPKNDVFYLKSENQNKTLLLNIILKNINSCLFELCVFLTY